MTMRHRHVSPSDCLWLLAVSLLTVTADVSWFGWQRQKHLNTAGYLAGPYTTGEVVGLVLTLAAVVLLAAWRQRWAAAASVPVLVTVLFSVQGATDPQGDGLWPIGAVLVFIAAALGTGLAIAATANGRGFLADTSGVKAHRNPRPLFNVPPGWPAPPPGWLPPPGWQPDPEWPPPPAGWQFLIEDDRRQPELPDLRK
jgi:hypothetical protein